MLYNQKTIKLTNNKYLHLQGKNLYLHGHDSDFDKSAKNY